MSRGRGRIGDREQRSDTHIYTCFFVVFISPQHTCIHTYTYTSHTCPQCTCTVLFYLTPQYTHTLQTRAHSYSFAINRFKCSTYDGARLRLTREATNSWIEQSLCTAGLPQHTSLAMLNVLLPQGTSSYLHPGVTSTSTKVQCLSLFLS